MGTKAVISAIAAAASASAALALMTLLALAEKSDDPGHWRRLGVAHGKKFKKENPEATALEIAQRIGHNLQYIQEEFHEFYVAGFKSGATPGRGGGTVDKPHRYRAADRGSSPGWEGADLSQWKKDRE